MLTPDGRGIALSGISLNPCMNPGAILGTEALLTDQMPRYLAPMPGASMLKKINSLVKIKITGAGIDFVEFGFAAIPDDWAEIAAECADIAPNIVQYGTGTLDVLEEELRQYNKAVLWWF